MRRGQLFFQALLLCFLAPNSVLGSEAARLRKQIQEVLEQNPLRLSERTTRV